MNSARYLQLKTPYIFYFKEVFYRLIIQKYFQAATVDAL